MDSPWTRFLTGFVLLAPAALACAELAWFGSPAPAGARALWVATVAAFSLACAALVRFVFVNFWCFGPFLAVPVAFAYFGGKLGLFLLAFPFREGRLVGLAAADTVATAFLVAAAVYANPTWGNIRWAIGARRHALLEFMLWARFGAVPLDTVVHTALQADNMRAVRQLRRHGLRGDVRAWVGAARSEEMRRTLVMLFLGEVDGGGHRPTDEFMADFGLEELRAALAAGGDPARHPHLPHAAITNQALEYRGTVSGAECRAIIDKLRVLLDHGAAADARDHNGLTPLMTVIAIEHDLTPVFLFLLKRGASVHIAVPTPIHFASRPETPAGVTPLMFAVILDRPRYVRLLLEHGADPAALDASGRTARDHANGPPGGVEVRALLATAPRGAGPREDSPGSLPDAGAGG